MADVKVIEIDQDRAPGEAAATGEAGADARPPRRYSKRNRDVQEFGRHASRGLHRIARSVEAGLREWREATDRSSRERKDGALRDALDNSARALEKQLRVASKVPRDAARALRSLKIGKAVRRLFPR